MTALEPLSTRASLLAAARDELTEKGEAALSLRAVARRAGLSHAAPAHFFGDKAGLLTAIAVEGFEQLTAQLEAAGRDAVEPQTIVARLGRVYVEFGLEHRALIDLMFRGSQLRVDDPALQRAKGAAIERLARAVGETGTADAAAWTLISWALVHGLVVLSREQAVAPLLAAPPGGAGAGAADHPESEREEPDDDAAAAAALVDRYVARAFGGAVAGSP